MEKVKIDDIKNKLYVASLASHKGQNGKLLVIGGSKLFHAASLWAAEIASKIVDMVYYSSVPENNKIFLSLKEVFRNGIVVARSDLENYVDEADCVLMGPGMVRSEIGSKAGKIKSLEELEKIKDEGKQTRVLTEYLLSKYPAKKWVLDAGALQMMEAEWLKGLNKAIVTPHKIEFVNLFGVKQGLGSLDEKLEAVEKTAREYGCVVLLKGKEDVVSGRGETFIVEGGNSGMTKGGTGDVLAGLVAGLACKNDLLLSARIGSWVNKTAGERLYKKVGPYFNASDLLAEVTKVLAELAKN